MEIRVMNESLANKIAAGEVAANLSNVVKELVENSLDAKSTNITINLKSSGKELIEVIDDGMGMNSTNAKKAFLRHATSKIYDEMDLLYINSMGFRGEALPSIASVSKLEIETSNKESGTFLYLEGGIIKEEKDAHLRKGTIIRIKNIFYNTPARLKYLRSDQAELSNITSYIEKLSLANINVSFTLTNNGKVIINTNKTDNLLKRIHDIYGLNVSKNMKEIKASNDDYEISGFISKPEVLKSTRNYFTTIVNKRVVRNLSVNKIINDAYHTYKPVNKFPVVVINITADSSLLDVNIHPTKEDIKFSKINMLRDLIFSAIKEVLNEDNLVHNITYEDILEEPTENNKVEDELTLFNYEEMDEETSSKPQNLEVVGFVFGTYIIAQNNEGLYLIDQHAAEERINYEIVLKEMVNEKISLQPMLLSKQIELTKSDYLKFKQNKEKVEVLGFNFEDFGINTIVIKEHPTWLLEGYEEETIEKLVEFIVNYSDFKEEKFHHNVAALTACHRSLKGNTKISVEDAEKIIEKLFKTDNPYNCPHGRPTIISWSTYEIEKMFKRVM